MTGDAPGFPHQAGSAGTASDGYLVERHIPAPRAPQPREVPDCREPGARRKAER